MLRLYSLSLMIVYTLDRRVIRLSSTMSSGSSPRSRYAGKGYVHVASARYTWTGKSTVVGVFSFGGDHNVVNIDLRIAPNLLLETVLHHALICLRF